MVVIGFLMLFLLGVSAFAVDLGWLYVNGSRVQRVADAAALAGVTHLPTDSAGAVTAATEAASANHLPIGGVTTMTTSVINANQFQVEVTTQVATFFLRVFGMDAVTVTKTATAEYIQPVPIGSPFSTFGDGPASGLEFWAAIQGQYAHREHGDPYSTACDIGSTADDSSCASANPTYRPDGYYLAVEVAPGTSSLSVQLFDAGFYQRPSITYETGDTAYLTGSEGNVISTIHYQLYDADTTPYDPTDNTPIAGCSLQLDPEQNPSTYQFRWAELCGLSSPSPGIYVLRVWTTGPGGESNHFGVRALSSGPAAKVYGLNDISIFANVSAGATTLYMAEIEPAHAGKTLELSFFDAGDASGWASVQILQPNGSTATCSWEAIDDVTGSVTASGSGTCQVQTTSSSGTRYFNSQWIVMRIDIPSTYTCSADCWWKVRYDYASQAHDRTTWAARVIGNPVRLIIGGAP